MRAKRTTEPVDDGALTPLGGGGWLIVDSDDGLVLVYRGREVAVERLVSRDVTRLWFISRGREYTREYAGIITDRAVRLGVRAIVRDAKRGRSV